MKTKNIFATPFEESAYKERLFFKNLQHLYNLFTSEEWHVIETPYTDYEHYDFLVYKHTPNGYKRYIIEIKIRQSIQDGYFYEQSKHNDLKKVKDLDPDNNIIIYINSTPEGTFIWNIDEILPKYKTTTREMNSHTVVSNNKENKKVYTLKKEDAFKAYPYHYDEQQFNLHIAEKFVNKEKQLNQINHDKNTLFKLLFGK